MKPQTWQERFDEKYQSGGNNQIGYSMVQGATAAGMDLKTFISLELQRAREETVEETCAKIYKRISSDQTHEGVNEFYLLSNSHALDWVEATAKENGISLASLQALIVKE